jgi:hypothetical protein
LSQKLAIEAKQLGVLDSKFGIITGCSLIDQFSENLEPPAGIMM